MAQNALYWELDRKHGEACQRLRAARAKATKSRSAKNVAAFYAVQAEVDDLQAQRDSVARKTSLRDGMGIYCRRPRRTQMLLGLAMPIAWLAVAGMIHGSR